MLAHEPDDCPAGPDERVPAGPSPAGTRAGPSPDREVLDAARFRLSTRDGSPVTDPALVAEAAELFRPQQDLGHQQGELGRQQGELGRQQGELGRQQGEIGREMGSLARQQAKEAAKHAVAVAKQARLRADDDDDDDDNSVKGQDFEQSMAQLRQKMETLSDEQKDLGGEQKKLGAQQKALGAEQSRLAHGADAKMQGLIDRALSSGAATPTPTP